MDDIKKVFIFTFPYAGHCNPIFGICKELKSRRQDIKIIVYIDLKFKSLFENCGVHFRAYKVAITNENWQNRIDGFQIASNGIDNANLIISDLNNDVMRDKPDLIMYDKGNFCARFSIDYFINEYKKNNLKVFKTVGYSTMLQIDNEYPNKFELKLLKFNILIFLFHALVLVLKRFMFYFKHNIKDQTLFSIWSPFQQTQNETTIIFTFPQFQPRSHLRNSSFKFVGSSFDELLHFNGIDDSISMNENADEIVKQFPIRSLNETKSSSRLVYVSLGTIFNDKRNLNVFLTILNALKLVAEIQAVIATGDKCYDYLKIKYELPPNVCIVKTAPQIEILKRASLFITHSGMNSTSESIHFGVPMICLPLGSAIDQPLVAYRAADELGLGIRLNAEKLDVYELKTTIEKVLNDESFYERSAIYRDISRKYNGIDNSVILIDNILKQ